jgi:dihydropteroate synthase
MRPETRAKRERLFAAIRARPVVMGILNVTPDSFSDGGRFARVDDAVAQARALSAEGCDVIDVGGESTRPEAVPVAAEEELRRVAPVLTALGAMDDVTLSIDTSKAAVAEHALDAGAVLVNDVWGLQKDPALAGVVAAAEAGVVLMHNRAERDEAIDIVADMRSFFDRSLAIAAKAGIPRERVLLDPGIGFGKTARQNRDALLGIDALAAYGLPVLIGVSRKGFLGSLTEGRPETTLAGTIAANLTAAARGARVFRVHDVAPHVAALRVFAALSGAE